MRPPEYGLYQRDVTERSVGDYSRYRSPAGENPPGHRRAFSAGAFWFLGILLLVILGAATLQLFVFAR